MLLLLAAFRRTAPAAQRWSLPANATRSLEPRGACVRLRSVRGTWHVTQAGDAADHLLGPGDELVTAARGRVVAWALTDGELAVAPVTRGRRARPPTACAPALRR